MAKKQVLVTYSGRNKVVEIPCGCDNEINFLSEAFYKKFDVVKSSFNVVFQRYDTDWECLVDLDNGSEIYNKDKLEAVTTANSLQEVNLLWISN